MNRNNCYCVIMAGGSGTRFWPVSRASKPKQFLDVTNTGRTFLRQTYDRFARIVPQENILIVTAEKYRDLVLENIPELANENLLLEPYGRNTAPCIAYATYTLLKRNPDAHVVVTPSDALVINVEEFRRVISEALRFTEKDRRIVTVGIRPSRPETGYGYIETGAHAEGEILEVNSFREKPCLEVARKYLEDGGYLWNAGIFVWNIDTITTCLRRYTPDLAAVMDEMSEAFYTDKESEAVGRLFPTCEKISIDYAVMEKADCIYTLPADFGWSDLGTWGSLRTLMDRNEDGNAVVGNDVRIFDCKDCIIHVPDLGRVVVQGLEGCIVAQHGDRLIVCRLDHEQGITQYSK